MSGVAEVIGEGFGCTWYRGNRICGAKSPAADGRHSQRELAIAAGWRIYALNGLGDPQLHPGEALCPDHVNEPSLGLRRKSAS